MYQYSLDRSSRKFICPECGKKRFVRVLDISTNQYLPDHVGRCDRESSCGYQFTWKDFVQQDQRVSERDAAGVSKRSRKPSSDVERPPQASRKSLDYLNEGHILPTLRGYEQDSLVRFLLSLFPEDTEMVFEVLRMYLVGTDRGYTVFPTISLDYKLCKAKEMKFDPLTGKRLREEYAISSLQSRLKRQGLIDESFETDKDVFFGEHLLRKHPDASIGIVESEKTALIATIASGLFPRKMVWLGSHSKSWLNYSRLRRIARNRTVILYPDADAVMEWKGIADDANRRGLDIKTSFLALDIAEAARATAQADLADFIIGSQQRINTYNAKLEKVLADPHLVEACEDIVEERKAILIIDGGLSEEAAEEVVSSHEYLRQIVESVFEGGYES